MPKIKSFSQALLVLADAGIARPIGERQADGVMRWEVYGEWIDKAAVVAQGRAYLDALEVVAQANALHAQRVLELEEQTP